MEFPDGFERLREVVCLFAFPVLFSIDLAVGLAVGLAVDLVLAFPLFVERLPVLRDVDVVF